MSAKLRAKVRIGSVLPEVSNYGENKGQQVSERVIGHAVYSDDPNSENKQWSQWAPSFHLDMTINNPSAFGKLSAGDEFYLDFIPVEKTNAP